MTIRAATHNAFFLMLSFLTGLTSGATSFSTSCISISSATPLAPPLLLRFSAHFAQLDLPLLRFFGALSCISSCAIHNLSLISFASGTRCSSRMAIVSFVNATFERPRSSDMIIAESLEEQPYRHSHWCLHVWHDLELSWNVTCCKPCYML